MKLLLSLALVLSPARGASFVDDAGRAHTLPADATIVAGVMDAVALSHFGLSSSRVMATLGERSSSGSNHGGYYYDGNVVYGETMNHSLTVYDPSIFPADPDAEERAFLDAIAGDLSANCSASNYYCDKVDVSYLEENGWPDVLVVGAFYSSLLTDELRNASRAANVPIVELKNSYGESEGDAEHVRNMVEMTERMEALAVALGLDVSASSAVEKDKRALCAAAATFQATAEAAHAAGVRAMAAYMPYQTNPQGVTGAFIPNPDRDPVLSMMQNLGLPLVFNEHSGDYWENRAGDYAGGSGTLTAEGTASLSGNHSYNVDFWLYDDRVSLDFLSARFAEDWPHPAVAAKQYAYWPSNARILSYRHAAEILNIVGERLETAERVAPPTDCTEPAGDEQFRDLGPGEYSCLHVFSIDFCPVSPGPEVKTADESSSVSLAVFHLVGLFVVIAFVL